MKRKRLNYLMFILILLIIPIGVYAASINVEETKTIKFNQYGITNVKPARDFTYKKRTKDTHKLVYCVVSSGIFKNGTYKSCNMWNTDAEYNNRMILAGQIIEVVNTKGWGDSSDKAYAYKVAALNNALGLAGNGRFDGGKEASLNTENGSIISDAKARRTQIKATSSSDFKKNLSMSVSTKTMSRIGSSTENFVSKKVTVTGIKTQYLNGVPSYSIAATGLETGQRIYLCKKPNGTGSLDGTSNACDEITTTPKTYTFSGTTTPETITDTFYVKSTGTDAVADDYSFGIKISGSVTISYSVGELYCKIDKDGKIKDNYQPLVIPKTKKATYSASKSLTFEIDKLDRTKHTIKIEKVDENGEPLRGAQFSAVNPPVTLSGPTVTKGYIFKFEYGPVVDDQFYGKEYCFHETVPAGYVDNNTNYCVTINSDQDEDQCLDSDGNEASTDDYCDSNIRSDICKKVTYQYIDNPNYVAPGSGDTGGDTGGDDPGTGGETQTVEPEKIPDMDHPSDPVYTIDSECAGSDTPGEEKVIAEKVCGILNGQNFESKNAEICANKGNYQSVEYDAGKVTITMQNTKTSVKISKKDATGNEEVPGAKLRVCTEASFKAATDKEKCTPAETVANGSEDPISLSWTSDTSPREFNGVPAGTYYIIETLPPAGYKKVSTYTKFTIAADGTVKHGTTTATDKTVVINNEYNDLYISKTDIVTTKELPGAKLSICEVVKTYDEYETDTEDGTDVDDEDTGTSGSDTETTEEEGTEETVEVDDTKVVLRMDSLGNCIPAKLANGEDATWTSGSEPKKISGLSAGTYYLVETTAPKGYSVSEAILFKMLDDGTLADKDGKSIANNKIVMKDEPLEDKKTGMLPIIIISLFAFVSLGALAYVYMIKNKKNDGNNVDNNTNNNLNNQEL